MTNLNRQAENYQPFKRPFVRDLAFALSCPTALTDWQAATHDLPNSPQAFDIHIHPSSFWQQQFSAYKTRLIELDNTPAYQKLTKFLISRPSPHRLGFHFEGLILFWLQDGYKIGLHQFELLAHNIQITENGQTFGELDIILRNHETGNIEHWELAIKFYLGSAPFNPVNWVGINSKDNLERKLNHMATKPFSRDYVTISSNNLNEQKLNIDKRYTVLKGRFFAPLLDDSTKFEHPHWLTKDFPLHRWYTPNQAVNLLQNKETFTILKPSQYMEWFTYRNFYTLNNSRIINQSNILQAKTGLYFLQQNYHLKQASSPAQHICIKN